MKVAHQVRHRVSFAHGIGEDLGLTDDTHTDISIGFPFRYYGMWYDSITVCSNGWISVEPSAIDYFWNFSIPMSMGPFGMIAPFMDDLDDNDGTEPFHVYAWQDASNGRLIIQWDNVANGEDDESCPDCVRETFQLILYDPSLYPTATGDGEIVFQYQEINDIDANGNYSTVGIESPDQNLGVQYLFNQNLAANGAQSSCLILENFNRIVAATFSIRSWLPNNHRFFGVATFLKMGRIWTYFWRASFKIY